MGTQLRGELMRYDGRADQFVSYLSGVSASGLDFSHDRQWVVYVSYPEGAMWRSRVKRSERQQLLDCVRDTSVQEIYALELERD